jgi:hypothetical protein
MLLNLTLRFGKVGRMTPDLCYNQSVRVGNRICYFIRIKLTVKKFFNLHHQAAYHHPKEGCNISSEKFSFIRGILGKLGLSKEAVDDFGLTVYS